MTAASDVALATELAEHLDLCKSAMLATLDDSGLPQSSYAPFVHHDHAFYLFVSQLAAHTGAMLKQPAVSLMLIEDEADARNPFARKRLTLSTHAEIVNIHSPNYETVLDQFERRHGDTVSLLRSLPDFILFRLTIKEGRFVKGFGQAHRVNEQLRIVSHINPAADSRARPS